MWQALFAWTNAAALIGWLLLLAGARGTLRTVRSGVVGLRALLASDGGIVVGWTHYLALDLFAGCWIADDANRRGVGRLARAPVLLATFLAGRQACSPG